MLIIAISHGFNTDPFTTSTNGPDFFDSTTGAGLNIHDAEHCREFICKDKNLQKEWIDEILIVYSSDYDEDPEVQHHYSYGE